jgi:uncharacterized protein (TIGR03083 family)
MPTRDDYLGTLHRDIELFADAIRAGGDLTQPIDGCPDWDLGALVEHVGILHRFIVAGIDSGDTPSVQAEPPADRRDYADWFTEGAVALEATLAGKPDDELCWTFFSNAPKEIGTWVRRQCQELAVHRYDAELAATGTAEAIDPDIAKDGIDEFFDLFLGRVDKRRPIRIGDLAVQLQSLDNDGDDRAWMVRCSDGPPVVTREHAKGDVALQGPSNALLLALWGRVEPGEMGLELYGSPDDWARFHEASSV